MKKLALIAVMLFAAISLAGCSAQSLNPLNMVSTIKADIRFKSAMDSMDKLTKEYRNYGANYSKMSREERWKASNKMTIDAGIENSKTQYLYDYLFNSGTNDDTNDNIKLTPSQKKTFNKKRIELGKAAAYSLKKSHNE